MSAYFQLGHNAENLVGEKDLDEFRGVILSPVNREPQELAQYVNVFRNKGEFDIILDPQMYFPQSKRGALPNQPYFPSNVDSANIASMSWWEKVLTALSDFAESLKIDALISPVVLPKIFSDDYYSICVDVNDRLNELIRTKGIKRLITTVMVDIEQMVDKDLILKIASIISRSASDGYYIVVASDVEPRREFSDKNELSGIMFLIRELKNTGRPVWVSYCSSDMILYKAAGATHCSTCKYFNLRRFTKARFSEPTSAGGGQLAYWFEHSLLGFLRQFDYNILIQNNYNHFLGELHSNNHWSKIIQDQFKKEPEKPWVALGWRQYLSWFGKTESMLSNNNAEILVRKWLKEAEPRWLELDDKDILFEEPRNNGTWIRPWRQAISDFSKT